MVGNIKIPRVLKYSELGEYSDYFEYLLRLLESFKCSGTRVRWLGEAEQTRERLIASLHAFFAYNKHCTTKLSSNKHCTTKLSSIVLPRNGSFFFFYKEASNATSPLSPKRRASASGTPASFVPAS